MPRSAVPDIPALTASAGNILLLASLVAIGQFSNSVYLPSFPAIGELLGASDAEVRLTLTAYVATFGVAQLFHGPLADRFGRRAVLFAGLAIFILASAACALAPTIEALIAARVFQALGACVGVVVARAVVRDSFEGDEMGHVLGYIAMAFAAVPAAAPLLGGLTQDLVGWRASFVLACAAGVAVYAVAWRRLPETNPHPLPRLDLRAALGRYGPVLGSPLFLGYATLSGAAVGGIFAFNAGGPTLFIREIGVSPTEFGLYPPITVTGFLIGGFMVRRLLGRWGEARLMWTAGMLLLAGAGLLVAFVLGGWVRVVPLIAATWVFVWGMGIAMPLSIAGAIRGFPERAGTAAAALGFVQMLAAAVGTLLVSAFAPLGLVAFPAAMLVMATLALGSNWFVRRTAAAR